MENFQWFEVDKKPDAGGSVCALVSVDIFCIFSDKKGHLAWTSSGSRHGQRAIGHRYSLSAIVRIVVCFGVL
jgi:hypothetical protein